MRNYFNEQEDNYLKYAHQRKYSLSKMAEDLGRPYGSICTRRRALGLKYDDRPAYGPRERVVQYELLPTEYTETYSTIEGFSFADYALFTLTAICGIIAVLASFGEL